MKKENTQKILMAVGALFAALFVIFLIIKVATKNREKRARNLVVAQQVVYESNYDKMFKVIAQVAQLPAEAAKTFNKIYPDLIKGRYTNERGGALISWIVENNPQFNFGLYDKIAEAVESNRQEFFNEGRKLKDYQREHANIVRTWPGSWFYGYNDTIAVTIITSDRTQKVFAEGKDNTIDLFPPDSITPK